MTGMPRGSCRLVASNWALQRLMGAGSDRDKTKTETCRLSATHRHQASTRQHCLGVRTGKTVGVTTPSLGDRATITCMKLHLRGLGRGRKRETIRISEIFTACLTFTICVYLSESDCRGCHVQLKAVAILSRSGYANRVCSQSALGREHTNTKGRKIYSISTVFAYQSCFVMFTQTSQK